MLGKVFKAYDVRAIYPKPLSEKLAWQIGHAVARYLTEHAADAGFDDPMMRHVVVGRDMRTSSPSLAEALKMGVRDYGAHVVDVVGFYHHEVIVTAQYRILTEDLGAFYTNFPGCFHHQVVVVVQHLLTTSGQLAKQEIHRHRAPSETACAG